MKVESMQCKECGSENFARNGGWTYCKSCGRVNDVLEMEIDY